MPEVNCSALLVLLHKRNLRFGSPFLIVEFAVVLAFIWQMGTLFDFVHAYDLAFLINLSFRNFVTTDGVNYHGNVGRRSYRDHPLTYGGK